MGQNKDHILTPSISLKYHLWVEKTDRNLSLRHLDRFFPLDPINLPVAATKCHSMERDRVSAWCDQTPRWPFRNNAL